MRILTILMAATVMLFAGCIGVITKGGSQPVTINSSPEGAVIMVDGVDSGETPLVLELDRAESHTVTVTMAGYEEESFRIARKTDGGVILLDVLLTGGIGLLIDMGSGAMYNLEPDRIDAEMSETISIDGYSINVTLQP